MLSLSTSSNSCTISKIGSILTNLKALGFAILHKFMLLVISFAVSALDTAITQYLGVKYQSSCLSHFRLNHDNIAAICANFGICIKFFTTSIAIYY